MMMTYTQFKLNQQTQNKTQTIVEPVCIAIYGAISRNVEHGSELFGGLMLSAAAENGLALVEYLVDAAQAAVGRV